MAQEQHRGCSIRLWAAVAAVAVAGTLVVGFLTPQAQPLDKDPVIERLSPKHEAGVEKRISEQAADIEELKTALSALRSDMQAQAVRLRKQSEAKSDQVQETAGKQSEKAQQDIPHKATPSIAEYRELAGKCTASLSARVSKSVDRFASGKETTGWQPWAETAELQDAHAKAVSAKTCDAGVAPTAANSWNAPKLAPERAASCLAERDGRQCVPRGCTEVEDAAKCAGETGSGGTPGTETLPPWAVVPTCEVLERCPALKGWPAQDHTLCTSDKTVTHCLAQLPAPALQEQVPELKHEYTPSKFEADWLDMVMTQHGGQPNAVCPLQNNQIDTFKTWIDTTEAWFATPTARATTATFDSSVFSTMKTTYTVPGTEEVKTATVPIEPLAGNLRHPFAASNDPKNGNRSPLCQPDSRGVRSLYDWRYLVMETAHTPDFAERYPGRKIFIDLGMTWFGERSLEPDYTRADGRTYVDLFNAVGIQFDLVYGWEPRADTDTVRFFKGLRSYDEASSQRALVPKYCNANKLSVADLGTADNAVELVAQLWRPGDYIVFKLDIDHGETELAILEQLKKCPHTVAELIFEYHCNVPEMKKCCWGDSVLSDARGRYDTALKAFGDLRKSGIRAHVWV